MKLTAKLNNKIWLLLLFLLSMIHPILLVGFFVWLIIDSTKSTFKGIQALNLIAIRTILNPAIAVNTSSVQLIKWATIFIICFRILYSAKGERYPKKVSQSIFCVTFFCFYICLVSLVNSSYPVVSIFKCISYGFVFCSVLVGISSLKNKVDIADELFTYLTVLMFGCILFAPFSFSYYSSASWFMGLTNQSQMFGIMAALYAALLIYQITKGKRTLFIYFMIFMVTALTFMSGSRTGMISTIICIIYGLYIEIVKNKRAWLLLIAVAILMVIGVFYGHTISEAFRTFILKDYTGTASYDVTLGNISLSRKGQYEMFLTKFQNNRFLGSGFMVPFESGVQSWSFSLTILVESGNLFYAVLGDLGFIGLGIFLLCYGMIFFKGDKTKGKTVLFLAPLLICMGEMVFFSTNNNAIILYTMIAAYLVG